MEQQEQKTNEPISDVFKCDICGEEYPTATELEEHLRWHASPSMGLRDEQSQIRGDIGAAGLPTSPLP